MSSPTDPTEPTDPQRIPGEVLHGDGAVEILVGRPTIVLTVLNTGDRPIQVGSHYHLAEVNPALDLDRAAARGFRLAIPAGTSVRFEPGIAHEVEAVAYVGARYVAGFRGAVAGPLDGQLERPSADGDPTDGDGDGDPTDGDGGST